MYLRNILIKIERGEQKKKGANNIKTKNFPVDQNSYQWFSNLTVVRDSPFQQVQMSEQVKIVSIIINKKK